MDIDKSEMEMQEAASRGLLKVTDVESKAYVHVFRAICREPRWDIPNSFAERILVRLSEAEARKSARRDFIWLGAGIATFMIAAIVSIALTGFNPSAGVFTFINKYPGLIAFGIALVLSLQWVDKKILVKNRREGKSQLKAFS